MSALLCLVGLPASGKSTAVTQMQFCHPELRVVSPDRIRTDLYGDAAIQGDWATIEAIVEAQLIAAAQAIALDRSSVAIYDATNANPKHRVAAIALARGCGFTTVIGLWFDIPIALCLVRHRARDRQVPEPVIERMDMMLRSHPPQVSDGFDRVIQITPAMPWSVWLPPVASWV